jgi:HicB-like protein involved in pilus formation
MASDAAGERERPRARSGTHSGRLLLRMPEALHAELARVSQRENVSLNQFITSVLAAAVGWGDGSTVPDARPPEPVPAAPRRRWLGILLVANFVLVAGVACVAIVLLVTSR